MQPRRHTQPRRAATLQRVGVAAPTLALSLGLAIAAYVYFPTEYEDNATAALRQQAEEITSMVAYTVAPALEFEDPVMAREVLAATRDVDALMGIALLDARGEVVASRGEPPTTPPTGAMRVRSSVDTELGDDGTVVADFSTAQIQAQVEETRATALTGGVVLVLMGLLLSLWSWLALGRAERLMSETRAAEAASKAKSEFIAHISHEVRTPLNGVIGTADLLATTELTEDQRRLVATVRRSSLALLAILDDILDYAKAEAGQIQVEHVAFDLEELVGDVVETFRATAEQKGVRLESEVAAPRFVLGDPLRLRQVLGNLTSNALKFTEEGSVSIDVREHDGGLRFEVTDTGIGIDPARRKRLFEAFAQEDVSTSRRYGGTGLGLSISAELARLMGGELDVQSELGRGSTFSFELPLEVAEHAGDATTAMAASPARALPPRRGKVLVAEDNAVNREVIAGMLGHLGVDHHIVADGRAALAAVEAHPDEWSLILMDFHMPGLDGLEAAKRIRALGLDSEALPILTVTAEATAPGERAGETVDGWLHKPLRIDQLREAVERWTSVETVASTPPSAPRQVTSSLIDGGTWAELEQVGDPEFLARLVGQFTKDTSDHITAIEAAARSEDLHTLRERAHALKGSSAFVAAKAVSERAHAIEEAAIAEDLPWAAAEATHLKEAFRRTLDELQARVGASSEPEEHRGRQHGT